jgi:ketosteroid isomerase-like protein
MKIFKPLLILFIAGLTLNSNNMLAQQANKPVEAFFSAFGKGDFQGILNSFDPNVEIIAARKGKLGGSSVYGTYQGTEGLKQFLTNLGASFDTQAFKVDKIVGDDHTSFAKGSFTHKVKSTGKLFSSDWALMCEVKDNKIITYHFFEDSAAFLEANAK